MITHLACVMDGNRRWATRQGKYPWSGHAEGAKTVETVIKFCLEFQIPYLSLYTFSLENFKRPEQEKSYIFDIVIKQSESYVPMFIEQGVKIKFIGDLSKFPDKVRETCKKIEESTALQEKLQVNVLFGYGAQQEILSAVQDLLRKVSKKESITKEMLESSLWTSGIPDPDLIIRTGGVQRLSNFLLYQSAYTEIRFLDTLWPDLTKEEIAKAVTSAVQAQKNTGK